ncbi:septation protein A [Actinobacillus delphinicola]|uniref:Inner membrane-spanning protein YciB n=1 Tax=Actinobacillus delphinicola TaxID=51161 RepID=A0A448TVH2_9PAST|nr:septation protein A [Actinobacillus delphinicola]MDG6898055.1 septation protein A [Actinobacillus delphinicola]VEJ09923.1 intracellular septation protein A [Actinobacillus delphinicola]
MKQILDFIPLLLFFIVYKTVGLRDAAITLVIATAIQLLLLKLIYKKIDKQALILGISVVVFASLTAYFDELNFLKWKVTLIYALFALVLLISQLGFKKNLMREMLGKEIVLPESVWKKINIGWAIFFIFCMLLNLYISQYFSDNIWVDFKTFGIAGLTFIATIVTSIYIYRYLPKDNSQENISKGKKNEPISKQ